MPSGKLQSEQSSSVPHGPTELTADLKERYQVHLARSRHKALRLLWLLIGPGILVMLGENDAPSMLSYAATGAKFGLGFFLPFIVLTFAMAFVIQEMTVRLGARTHLGHGALIYLRFGRFWGHFALADLLLTNFLTLITEFVGIVAGAGFFGIPPEVAVSLGVVVVMAAVIIRSYFSWERLVLLLAVFNLIFVPLAFMAHPPWHTIGTAFLSGRPFPTVWNHHTFLLVLSDIGATITPWMVFFQQGAVRDKGLSVADIAHGQFDTVLGTFLAALAGVACMVVTSVLYGHLTDTSQLNAGRFAQALIPYIGHMGGRLFALGILEAGLVAAVTISTSSAYAFGEVFHLAHSLNRPAREACGFYAIMAGIATAAGMAVLIPGLPLETVVLVVNALAVLTMPPAILFLLLLTNDREIMGSYRNTWVLNVLGATVGAVVSLAGIIYAISLLVTP
ncbi:MAG: divalent metal cation transporter [Firmicutes bacterium]|nr:divalent metal cation transporter [Bacillota bacterium]